MRKLYPEDQKNVEKYLYSNVNSVERKEFKPFRLLGVLLLLLVVFTAISYWIALGYGLL